METFDERDREFLAQKALNPGLTFAQYQTDAELLSIRAGNPHATLGPNLRKYQNWWEAGLKTFERFQRLFPLHEDNRVVDYGCGSLRIGGHFINFLNPDRYFGVDVTDGFYEMGKTLLGEDMLGAKRPRFSVIGESSLAAAAGFGADFVYSTAVSYHVHPNEAEIYYGNLARLTSKPGATLFFDVSISDQPVRNRSWAWPLDHYRNWLAELEFVKMHGGQHRDEGANFSMGILEFRRP